MESAKDYFARSSSGTQKMVKIKTVKFDQDNWSHRWLMSRLCRGATISSPMSIPISSSPTTWWFAKFNCYWVDLLFVIFQCSLISGGVWHYNQGLGSTPSNLLIHIPVAVAALCHQLQKTWKGDLGMSNYLSQMKKMVDVLQSAGVQVSNFEFILRIIDGLDSDFESIMAVIMSQIKTLSLPEVRHLLVSQEIRIARINSISTSIHSANLVFKKDKKHSAYQICRKKGHIALACHN